MPGQPIEGWSIINGRKLHPLARESELGLLPENGVYQQIASNCYFSRDNDDK
jgi:hypothetical protein